MLLARPTLSRQAGLLFSHSHSVSNVGLVGVSGVVSRRNFSASPVAAATLKELESRIRSVKNIEKITKSMKMIATTRLNKAQKAMREAKGYGEASGALFQNVEVAAPKDGDKILYIVVSSDRGLCGGIHSSVSKRAKKELAEEKGESQIVVLGDKPKAQLGRAVADKFAFSVNQIGRSTPTYEDALAVAELISTEGLKYDYVKIIYNKFISVISYESEILTIASADLLQASQGFTAYEVEDDALAKDLVSFSLANAVYTALVEGHASEISSRRNAMENASKNAGEMINSLQMQFNTKRQGAITNELVDIITGASAL